jgi:hypothetical protein
MAATIKIKNSSTASAVPTSSDLVQGELAVNVTDKRLFTENASGTVVELGTNPTILTMGAAGSASAPVITRTGDTNTGIFFPAADTIAFAEGGTETMRLDSSGNLGLGVTPSAWGGGFKAFELVGGSVFSGASTNLGIMQNAYYDGTNYLYKTSSTAARYFQVGGQHIWYNAASGTAGGTISFTQAMTLDASGNLGIGTTSPASRLDVYSTGNTTLTLSGSSGGGGDVSQIDFLRIGSNVTSSIKAVRDGGNTSGALTFYTAASGTNTERARITSGGYFKASNNGTYGSGNYHEVNQSASDERGFVVFNRNASLPLGFLVDYTAAAPNDTGKVFLECRDTGATRATIRSNGGIANYSANNVNLSDRREKTNFAPAGDYLAKICAIPVQTFNYIDQNLEEDDGLTLGVVAQDVQAVAPELVMESNWASKDEEPKMRLSIYQTDLQYALMKCIQEQQAIITALTNRITALEQA